MTIMANSYAYALLKPEDKELYVNISVGLGEEALVWMSCFSRQAYVSPGDFPVVMLDGCMATGHFIVEEIAKALFPDENKEIT